MKINISLGVMLAATLILNLGVAHAQTGVSDDRVSLPGGPGSLEGVGENVDADPNMGMMSYGVPINVPQGFPGVTPQLRLAYSSGGGSGPVGVGWSMMTPYIERMTYRGLPEYIPSDDFSANGGQQLVQLPGEEIPTYRARFEKGFVRYKWHDSGDGTQGYWTAEYPDGRVGYFGASADGQLVPASRVGKDEGTFRYMLVEMVDVYGHSMRYSYQKFGEVALVRNIGYVFNGELEDPTRPIEPRYSVSFQYEERRDATGFDTLSDAKAGFDEKLTQRLSAINVFSGAERIRRYELAYESYADSGGFTRLRSVQMLGLGDEVYPARNTFTYSQALGGVCGEQACAEPFIVDMGNIGVNIGVGRATLLDINGDSLPDIINTSSDGPHTFLLNVPTVDGSSSFEATPRTSTLAGANGSNFRLGNAFVHPLDVNGDGFTDLIQAQTGRMLINRGSGDWEEFVDASVGDLGESLNVDFDPDEGELRSIRFLDYDNDKRIDLLRSTRTETRVIRNTGAGFEDDPDVDLLGYGIQTDNILFSDMNGDGLLDAVKLNVNSLRYKLNYGWGKWGDEVEVIGLPIDESELERASLEDLNGDGLSDLVIVTGTQIKYAINRNGTVFTNITTLGPADVNGELFGTNIPVTVLYADMNGSGSNDIVWLTTEGDVKYLELFPVRPNLLSRIENGLGKVTDITYSTSVSQMARDGGWEAWEFRLPNPMLVVDTIDDYDLLSNIHNITNYRYHDGFYDGVEKQFRGYARVEVLTPGDDFHEDGLTSMTFDVGATDPYRNGLQLTTSTMSNERTLSTESVVYEDCPLEDIPSNTELAIRFVCKTAQSQIVQEGADPSEWATIESSVEYDGYGNVTLSRNFGVTAIGGQGCAPCDRDEDEFGAPCGAQCLGDELYTETEFIPPGPQTSERWILNAAFRSSSYGRPGSELKTETLTYYDGDPFVGLPLGTLDQKKVTRITQKVDDTKVIEQTRARFDEDGNVIETIAPNGSLNTETHRRRYTMDDDKLRVTQLNMVAGEIDGRPYELQRNITYEPTFNRVVSNSVAMLVIDGEVVSPPRSTTYTYDAFGRLTSTVLPGNDSASAPTRRISYELGNPVTRFRIQQNSQEGGELDLENIQCLDGKGRLYQTRQRISEGRYQVDGLKQYNSKDAILRQYQPYVSTSAECDALPPENTPFSIITFDAADRPLTQTVPDESIYGTPSTGRNIYLPLGRIAIDPEDNDPQSSHTNTPTTMRMDGLERVVAIERILSTNDTPAITRPHYDSLGRVTGYSDADNNRKIQRFDLVGRTIEIEDPNTKGSTLYRYDDNGNLISFTDPRGVETRMRYDSLNRLLERWDAADQQATSVQWTFDRFDECPDDFCTNTTGLLAHVTYPGLQQERGHDFFGYDIRGRQTQNMRRLAGAEFRFGQRYDNTNRVILKTYPNGASTTWTYDGAARLKSIDGFVDNIEYDDRSNATSVTRHDGSTRVTSHDTLQRITQDTVINNQGDVLQGWAYTYDRLGNRLEIEDLSDAAKQLNTSTRIDYDAWYRTTRVHYTDADEVQNTSFDRINNIVGRNFEGEASFQTDFQYDPSAPNALLQAGDTSFGYDAAGHATERGEQRFTWDYKGRVTAVAQNDGTPLLQAGYGPGSRRLFKIEGDSTTLYLQNDFELRDGVASLYVRMGQTRIARQLDDSLATSVLSDLSLRDSESDGQINAADAWFSIGASQGNLDVTGEPSTPGALLMSSLHRMFADATPDITHLHHNHLGSITLATVDGQQVGKRTFTDLGKERASIGYVDPYGFTGQEEDASTGLLCFMWRLYDPNVGRWMSIDPLFRNTSSSSFSNIADSTTGYAYVRNNFANLNDPYGLNPKGDAKGDAKPNVQKPGATTLKRRKKKQKAAEKRDSKATDDIKQIVKKDMKKVNLTTGAEANAFMQKNFKHGEPFKRSFAYQGQLKNPVTLIRVFSFYTNKDNVRVNTMTRTMYLSPDSDLAQRLDSGKITQVEVQQALALPRAATHFAKVTLPAGTNVLVGKIGPQPNYKDADGDPTYGGSSQVVSTDNKTDSGRTFNPPDANNAKEIPETLPTN